MNIPYPSILLDDDAKSSDSRQKILAKAALFYRICNITCLSTRYFARLESGAKNRHQACIVNYYFVVLYVITKYYNFPSPYVLFSMKEMLLVIVLTFKQ